MNATEKNGQADGEGFFGDSEHGFFGDVGVFDPFGLGPADHVQQTPTATIPPSSIMSDGETASISILPPPEVNRTSRDQTDPLERTDDEDDTIMVPSSSTNTMVIPPRLTIKFSHHEEVSSMALQGSEDEGASEIFVEGNLTAQIQSSDARKNTPFLLIPSTSQAGSITFRENEEFVSESTSTQSTPLRSYVVNVPKMIISTVPLGTYSMSEQVRHMPLLLERKVTMNGTKCRVAVQVRSKLSNRGDLHDFTIAVALPERVNIETVEILRGEGYLDELKRTIKWSKEHLLKGESFMVSAHGDLWSSATIEDQETMHFPVLLRCTSHVDQISSVEFRAMESDDSPASMQLSRHHSFRLLHRLK